MIVLSASQTQHEGQRSERRDREREMRGRADMVQKLRPCIRGRGQASDYSSTVHLLFRLYKTARRAFRSPTTDDLTRGPVYSPTAALSYGRATSEAFSASQVSREEWRNHQVASPKPAVCVVTASKRCPTAFSDYASTTSILPAIPALLQRPPEPEILRVSRARYASSRAERVPLQLQGRWLRLAVRG